MDSHADSTSFFKRGMMDEERALWLRLLRLRLGVCSHSLVSAPGSGFGVEDDKFDRQY